MKQLYTYIAIIFVGMAALCACTDEVDLPYVAKEGTDVTLKLSVRPEIRKEVVNSRATNEENKLYDLHFYVFNASGKLTGYEYFESEDGYIIPADGNGNIPTDDVGNTVLQTVNIRTKTGTSYIYAVANINSGSTYYLSDEDKEILNVTNGVVSDSNNDELFSNAVKTSGLTRTAFLGINFRRSYSTGENQNFSPNPIDNIFMMSGYLNDGNSVTIQKEGDIVSINEGVKIVKLYRILAKNTLTIASPSGSSGKFTPKSYRFCNVPKTGMLVPNAYISTANTATNYTEDNITDAEVESSYQLSSTNSTITFYYPENLQIPSEPISAWKEREANLYTDGIKSFTNAPEKSAYIEIQGDYVDESLNITANVTYTIHFGHFTKDKLNDFNVIRNNHYIYTVYVNGVKDITAEAQLAGNNPYAEGLVIKVGSGSHFEVDAHYEARVLKFDIASIQALKGSHTNTPGYILNVNTPFGNTSQTVNVKSDGVYTLNNDKICSIEQATNIDSEENANIKANLFQREADFRWMRFVRNTTSNVTKTGNDISRYTCKYPGDGDDDNPRQWLNVFELLAELYDENTYTDNNRTEAYYTCFIDENYYANKNWSEYVNKDSRTMQIANKLFVSDDQKSVYAEVAYSISQRSIATFYTNTDVKAFGIEIIDEEDVYDVRLGSSNEPYTYYRNMEIEDQDDWNAFTSGYNTNLGRNWYSYDGNREDGITTINPDIQPLYKAAAKACMSRNRDANGDGNIDDGEIRWYLAAVDQYRAIYYAQNVLPADARLINETELTEINQAYTGRDYGGRTNSWGSDTNGHDFRGHYHYWTCSNSGESGTFWPEEGLTNNPVQASWGVSRAEMVRCVRTLENEGNGLYDPELFYSYDSDTRTFTLDGIRVNRNILNKPLDLHNEVEELNDFYTSFVVASNDVNSGRTYTSSQVTTGSDPCLEYSQGDYGRGSWRTPNQKEMALMLSEGLISKNYDYGTRTQFTGHTDYNWHTSPGFISDNGSLNLTSTNVRVRCVRDN